MQYCNTSFTVISLDLQRVRNSPASFCFTDTDNLNWQLYLHIYATVHWAASAGLQDLLWWIRVLDTWGGWGASKAGNPPASFTYFNIYLFWNPWLPRIQRGPSLGLGKLLRFLTKKKKDERSKNIVGSNKSALVDKELCHQTIGSHANVCKSIVQTRSDLFSLHWKVSMMHWESQAERERCYSTSGCVHLNIKSFIL